MRVLKAIKIKLDEKIQERKEIEASIKENLSEVNLDNSFLMYLQFDKIQKARSVYLKVDEECSSLYETFQKLNKTNL